VATKLRRLGIIGAKMRSRWASRFPALLDFADVIRTGKSSHPDSDPAVGLHRFLDDITRVGHRAGGQSPLAEG
jgi:hypothetical protein